MKKCKKDNQEWTTIIQPNNMWNDIKLGELLHYKDLIFLFVKKNFAVQYKQTILGPLWFILNPLLTTYIYTLIFGGIAGISTEGVPQFLFYLASYSLWMYFSTCIIQTSKTFTGNASILGKVYFPRLVMPISTIIFSLINLFVVLAMLIITMFIYFLRGDFIYNIGLRWLMLPILVLQTATLSLGCGIIVSALTTKYRDLAVLVEFGVQLLMFATPVVYPVSSMSVKMKRIVMLNPMAPVMNNFRYFILGCGTFDLNNWLLSLFVTVIILIIGILLFSKVEKTFMDTV
ncbi:lipopolysaccharide transport system permease protein [Lachnospiraceae bacterium NLAE-zl-G231]|nr:lipopolysaccharide transport system permease protein [Lachnospiraceae bacterium NLAE-zl-G231]